MLKILSEFTEFTWITCVGVAQSVEVHILIEITTALPNATEGKRTEIWLPYEGAEISQEHCWLIKGEGKLEKVPTACFAKPEAGMQGHDPEHLTEYGTGSPTEQAQSLLWPSAPKLDFSTLYD